MVKKLYFVLWKINLLHNFKLKRFIIIRLQLASSVPSTATMPYSGASLRLESVLFFSKNIRDCVGKGEPFVCLNIPG